MRNPSKRELIAELRRQKILSRNWRCVIKMEQASVEFWKGRCSGMDIELKALRDGSIRQP